MTTIASLHWLLFVTLLILLTSVSTDSYEQWFQR